MKKTILYIAVPALVLLSAMIYLLCTGEQSAAAVRESVVRFHVVADSNDPEDQALKLKVRDGLFSLIQTLFEGCADQEEALQTARRNQALLEERAEQILQENGSTAPVTLEIGTRFFPTRNYGSFSFPAGTYQAVSLRIGSGAGENFWCVLYPALCIAPAVAEEQAEEELTVVVGEESTSFLQKEEPAQKIRFALVEWFEFLREKYLKS